MSPTNMNEFKLIQVNINSLISKAKRAEFNQFLIKHKPDIVMLSETKLKPRHNISFSGYKVIRNDRETEAEENNGGGTAILYKHDLECEPTTTPSSITTFECSITKLKLKNNKNLIIASIYKPPTELINKKIVLIKIKAQEINNIFSIDKNAYCIIGGDFNSKHTAWNNKTNCINGNNIYHWYETFRHSHDIQIYTSKKPTCKRSIDGTNIDFGFISKSLTIIDSTSSLHLPSQLITDHAAIFLNIKIESQIKPPILIKNYKSAKWTQLKNYIENELNKFTIPTTHNITEQEINTITTKLNEIYNKAIDTYIPNIEIRNCEITLSNQTLALIKEEKKLLRKKHRNRLSANYNKINSDLKIINCMIFNSIKTDYSKQMEQTIKNVCVDNNVFKNIKKITTYKKRRSNAEYIILR